MYIVLKLQLAKSCIPTDLVHLHQYIPHTLEKVTFVVVYIVFLAYCPNATPTFSQ